MALVSIIVPVYRVEDYLGRCIESILAQTYSEFELILIDDGSPDGSGIICDKYAQSDPRIRVIHQKNQGASAARNRGLHEAHGEYIMFCDSDDTVSSHWISRLMQFANRETLPMGSYCHEASSLGIFKVLSVPSGDALPSAQYYRYNCAGIAGFLCNSLFITQIIREHHLQFREKHTSGDFNEDLLFTLEYVRHIKYLVYTGYADYLYDTHEGSLSRSFPQFYFRKYQEKFLLWQQYLAEFCPNNDMLANLAQTTLYHFLTALGHQVACNNYRQFRAIVLDNTMVNCLQLSHFPN
jgi:glycosyltransferase involved in cell wall biosynthesis